MEKKKAWIILALLSLLAISLYFAVRQFGKSKKTISVVNLSQENNQQAETESEKTEKEVISNQSSVIEGKAANEKPQQTVNGKEAAAQQQATVESKPTEKKVSEPEKLNQPTSGETKGGVGKIVQKLIDGGFQKSTGRKVDTIIVHTSYNSLGGNQYDAEKIIDIYQQYGVSAHYLILRDGVIYQLVTDQNIAWHAGVSEMPDGRKNVNDFSVGIEVINNKDDKFTPEQYAALNSLIATLKRKYPIKNILGHDEIAPGRKADPWGIEWKKVDR